MAKRKSVNYPGYSHQNPIPNVSRIGNIVMSSIMNGTEPGTRNIPPDLAAQVTNIFSHQFLDEAAVDQPSRAERRMGENVSRRSFTPARYPSSRPERRRRVAERPSLHEKPANR